MDSDFHVLKTNLQDFTLEIFAVLVINFINWFILHHSVFICVDAIT